MEPASGEVLAAENGGGGGGTAPAMANPGNANGQLKPCPSESSSSSSRGNKSQDVPSTNAPTTSTSSTTDGSGAAPAPAAEDVNQPAQGRNGVSFAKDPAAAAASPPRKTTHGFGRPTQTQTQTQTATAAAAAPAAQLEESSSSAINAGILSEVALLRGLGTKQVIHTIPSNASSRSPSVGSGASGSSVGLSLPLPPLSGTKRGAEGQDAATGTPDDLLASSSQSGKKKRKASRRGRALPTNGKDNAHLNAAAALTSLASSSDSDDGPGGGGGGDSSNHDSSPGRKAAAEHLLPPHDAYLHERTDESLPPHLHGVLSGGGGKIRTALMVDHTYTDYSIVDPQTLRALDEEQGLSGSGYEWRGLNEDPFPPRPDEVNSTPEKTREMEIAMHNLQMLQLSDPAYIRDKERTIRKLKKLFKGIRPGRRNSGGVIQPFPGKLMEVLDRDDLGDVISWMPHGRAFCVKQPKVFTADILPRFFKQSKYMSFTRQLNLWGFKRITRGRDAGAYYHELFLRGRPRLTLRMRRQKIKGTGIKLTPNPEAEPNFYEMARTRPLPCPAKRTEGGSAPLPPMLDLTTFGKKNVSGAGVKRSSSDEKSPNAADAAGTKKKRASRRKKAASNHKQSSISASSILDESSPLPMPPLAPGETSMMGSPTMAGAAGPDASALAAELLRRREQAAASELMLGTQNESQLEAMLRFQAVELKQKQEIAIASQGVQLLRQVEGAIPGAPTSPAVGIPELQQRLLAAAAALDQPAVQAAVMEDQRLARLAAILAPATTGNLTSPILGGGGGVGSRAGNIELELIKQRLANLPPSASAIHQAATEGKSISATDILNRAAAIESRRQPGASVGSESIARPGLAALQQYVASSQQSAAASAPGSPVLNPAAHSSPLGTNGLAPLPASEPVAGAATAASGAIGDV